jgi:hypothetical protein
MINQVESATLCLNLGFYEKSCYEAVPAVMDKSGEWAAICPNRRAWRPYNIQQIRELFYIPEMN